MNTKMLRHVRTLFNTEGVERRINRHNQRKWVRAILRLGDRWVHAKPMGRLHAEQSSS